ncbi:MAG: hypothetical protein A3I68_02910 [Candidatus Melainabacteria bacterium RIFCSPLOWO2_02_FULL_35_15]|nr:MAG: hypothetical protein A3F80_01105 [Candidatus Melainabacteria bacterium RIFCSPLOWO2_12_FULL_35_11]OGI13077.1 MAG: hypothetical protein A3I68_02910 [Candidatus Melainabacteria bacterium RIFCSPLOWO2_02_FULL_35_15]
MKNVKGVGKSWLPLTPTGRNESIRERKRLEGDMESWMNKAKARTGQNLQVSLPKTEDTTKK